MGAVKGTMYKGLYKGTVQEKIIRAIMNTTDRAVTFEEVNAKV